MRSTIEEFRLGDVIEIASGQVDPRESPYAEMPHIGGDNIESNTGRLLGIKSAAALGLTSGKYQFCDSDILYSKIRPNLNKVAAPTFSGICSADIYPIRPIGGKVEKRYLLYVLRSNEFLAFAEQHSTRTNIPKINRTALLSYTIPLPPLPEQKRIADILDKADTIRRKRQEAFKEFQSLQNAAFFELFGDPRKNPHSLASFPLQELVKVKSGDFLPQREMDSDGSHAVYGGNGINGRHSKFLFEEPKIVIGRVGAYCGAVHITEPESWITDNALFIAEKDDRLTDLYLAEALRLANLNQYASQSGQPLISGSRIYRVEILVPPLEQQDQFAKIASSLKLAEARLITTESETTDLFNTLVQRAFKGEL